MHCVNCLPQRKLWAIATLDFLVWGATASPFDREPRHEKQPSVMMTCLKAFIAGFVSTLVFHQGLLWLLYAGGLSPMAPWNMTLVPPLHAPAVISLAFW